MDYFKISLEQNITLPKKADNLAITTMLENYAAGVKWNITYSDCDTKILIGDYTVEDRGNDEYVINITEKGVYIEGSNYSTLMSGFYSLLEMIFCYGKYDYRVDLGLIKETGKVKMRAIHICLFPDYSFELIRKYIRAAAVCKYTHIILETWGALKLDSLKELAWEHGLSKEQVRELVAETNALGMEMIPFFQHLGHASLSRLGFSGKHVVLDQNPELEYLYYPRTYGWVWNFKSEEVRTLLKNVRHELMDLFGKGEYFHLGCDESGYEFDSDELADYLNQVNADLKAHGRRPIIWGDMLLSTAFFPGEEEDPRRPGMIRYECNSTEEYALSLLEKLDKNIVIADWEYQVESAPWKSSLLFKEKGFDVLCCPWEYTDNLTSAVATARDNELLGVMETTWHKLVHDRGTQRLFFVGQCAFGNEKFQKWTNYEADRVYTIFRKVAPRNQEYKDCGWLENQV